MTQNAPTLPARNLKAPMHAPSMRPAIRVGNYSAPAAPKVPNVRSMASGSDGLSKIGSWFAHRRRITIAPDITGPARGAAFLDGVLLLLAVCAILLPTSAGYSLANAAAHSIIGLPFAVLMFFSPFALMALLPLRILYLALDGLFGIRLRLNILAPLALVCLAMFLFLGPLSFQPASVPTANTPQIGLPATSPTMG
ncbi:MAG: hypothetical protein ACRBBU_05380 [Pseudooceanicola sp.]